MISVCNISKRQTTMSNLYVSPMQQPNNKNSTPSIPIPARRNSDSPLYSPTSRRPDLYPLVTAKNIAVPYNPPVLSNLRVVLPHSNTNAPRFDLQSPMKKVHVSTPYVFPVGTKLSPESPLGIQNPLYTSTTWTPAISVVIPSNKVSTPPINIPSRSSPPKYSLNSDVDFNTIGNLQPPYVSRSTAFQQSTSTSPLMAEPTILSSIQGSRVSIVGFSVVPTFTAPIVNVQPIINIPSKPVVSGNQPVINVNVKPSSVKSRNVGRPTSIQTTLIVPPSLKTYIPVSPAPNFKDPDTSPPTAYRRVPDDIEYNGNVQFSKDKVYRPIGYWQRQFKVFHIKDKLVDIIRKIVARDWNLYKLIVLRWVDAFHFGVNKDPQNIVEGEDWVYGTNVNETDENEEEALEDEDAQNSEAINSGSVTGNLVGTVSEDNAKIIVEKWLEESLPPHLPNGSEISLPNSFGQLFQLMEKLNPYWILELFIHNDVDDAYNYDVNEAEVQLIINTLSGLYNDLVLDEELVPSSPKTRNYLPKVTADTLNI
jgi:hypothetical protein